MGRTVPFDPGAVCDGCGTLGAFDFMGDLYCPRCATPPNEGCEDCDTLEEAKEIHRGN